MAKFYTDGSEGMVLYTITDKAGVKTYSKDKDILSKALLNWIHKTREDDTSITKTKYLRNYDFVWTEDGDNTVLDIYYRLNTELVETFKVEKLTIPNSMFDPMPSAITLNWRNTIPVPCTDKTVDILRNTTGSPVTNPVTIQSETAPEDTTTVRNVHGDSVGIIKTVGVEDNKISPFESTVNIPTVFGSAVIADSDINLYQSRLNEAKTMYGTKIENFIVKNSNLLKPADIEMVRKTYFNGADSAEPAYVFSLHDFSVHAINANGSHVTLL